MRNFIGNILIGLAAFITFLYNMLFFILILGIVMGIFMITMIGFFDLIGHIIPNSETQMNILKKPIWDIIAVVLGSATVWLGLSKMFENDKQLDKNIEILENE